MAENTACPKCKTGKMEDGNVVLMVPALRPTGLGTQSPISDQAGMPVKASCCQTCHYVEFFALQM